MAIFWDDKALRDAIRKITDADVQRLTTSVFASEKANTVIVELEK